jgi:hypothetical protein
MRAAPVAIPGQIHSQEMTMLKDHLRTVERRGRRLLAKLYDGEEWPVTYANRTQAQRMCDRLKADLDVEATVYHTPMYRPFYVEIGGPDGIQPDDH